MAVLYANNATSTLATAISTSSTSLVLQTGHGARFPAITSPDYFYATLDNGTAIEIVKVTARTTDTLTVTRAQDGTTATAFAIGATVDLRITKLMLDDMKAERLSLAAGGTVSGTLTVNASFNNSIGSASFAVGATSQTTGSIVLGGNLSTSTGAITVGQSATSQTLGLGVGATAAAATKTVNVGTGGLASSTTNINIGSAVASSTTNINAYGTWDFKNSTLNGVGNLVINDPGPGEGIEWAGGSGWKIYESPNDLSNAGGNLQFVTGSTRLGTLDTTGWFEAVGGLKAPQITVSTSNDYITNTTGLESWTYASDFSISAQTTEPRGIQFSNDGTKMYLVGNSGGTAVDSVIQYTLGTAWSLATATYTQAFSLTAQTTSPLDLFFKPDGTVMYVLDDTTDVVLRYNLGTAWDISTAVYANSFSVAAQETSVSTLAFSTDGTTMYVGGTSGDDINQYNLGTAWDITTAVYANIFSIAAYATAQDGLAFNSTGTVFWVVDNSWGRVVEYTLGTAWDITTAVYSKHIAIYISGAYLASSPSGVFVNEAQGKAYFCDYNTDRVFELTTNLNATKFVGSKFYFYPDTHFRSDITVYGNIRAETGLYVAGNTVVSGTFTANTLASTSSSTTGTVYGTISSGTINIATGLSTGTLNFHTAQTTGALTIGGTAATGNINIGRSTAAQTINIGYGATAAATTKTLNLGTAGVSGSITNINYGSAVAGAASSHNFYGGLGIGGTALAGYTINGTKAITGATTGYGVVISGAVQSDVTTAAQYFRTTAQTAAAAFALPQLNHFTADQGTFGAGSTVTTQIGYAANASLTGATNNYGFYGNIAAGTGRYNFYAAGTADNYMAGSLFIGVTTGAANRLRVQYNVSDITATSSTILADGTHTLTANNAVAYGGIDGQAALNQGGFNATISLASGGSVRNRNYITVTGASGTVTAAVGMFSDVRNTAAGTLTNAAGFSAIFANSGGGVLTNAINYYAPPTTVGTNNYGFYGDIAAGTGRYNLYMNGTADNYFAGNVGIGSTTLTGTSLRISKNVTGSAFSYGAYIDGQIQSDVTSEYASVQSTPTTQAAAFTLNRLRHFYANQGTIGAGSTVTNQYGFAVENSLIGATNNFGFHSNIASGTGRYNFYAAGTADNYFAGNVGVGTNTPSRALSVYGATAPVIGLFNSTTGTTISDGLQMYIVGLTATISNKETGDLTFETSATERVRIDSAGNVQVETGAIVPWAPAPAAISTTATLTNANIQGQIINTTGTTYTVTMPLGTTMETLVPWAAVNLGYDFYVVNTASGTITIAVNTGVTAVGGLTVATGVSAQFRIRRTAANTFILYRLG